MDVFDRDVEGGLKSLVDGLPYIDGAQSLSTREVREIGFVAKAYQKDGTTCIAYRGTDDDVKQCKRG